MASGKIVTKAGGSSIVSSHSPDGGDKGPSMGSPLMVRPGHPLGLQGRGEKEGGDGGSSRHLEPEKEKHI